jgi:hypothetical protein
MFTPAFLKHYPTPWRVGDASSPEVVDCHGDHVIPFEFDTPEDREFWENVVAAVNAVPRAEPIVVDEVDDDALIRVGTKVVEMAASVKAADVNDLGARGTWHLEIDDERFRVVLTVAGTAGITS